MKKYEEEHYLLENIKDKIYPWVKEELRDIHALNGKDISEKNTPLISFVGDLTVMLVIQRGEDAYEIIKDNMLPPDCDIEQLYYTACENLAKNVEYVIGHTWFGGMVIVADGYHEASSLCLRHIWDVCAQRLEDDLAIMVPSKDMVVFVPAGDEVKLQRLIEFGNEAYARSQDRVSRNLLLFTREGKELLAYDKVQH